MTVNIHRTFGNSNTVSSSELWKEMHRVARILQSEGAKEVSFTFQLTILIGFFRRIKETAGVRDYLTMEAVEQMKRNIGFHCKWVDKLKQRVDQQGLPYLVTDTYTKLLSDISSFSGIMHRSICQEIEKLMNPPLSTFLKDEESLENSPHLKDKLVLSTKQLVDAASNDICTICIVKKISTQEDFAILDKCAHLFCRTCIGAWLETKLVQKYPKC